MIERIKSYTVNMILLVFGATIGLFTYWWAVNTFTLSTKFENPRVVGVDTYKVGDTIRLAYEVTRYRSCKLEIGRYVRRSKDRREVLMQSLTQIVPAGNPPIPMPSGYVAKIPEGLLNPDEKRVDADVFSRVQYYCNGLDWLWPRIVDMEPVKVVIVIE